MSCLCPAPASEHGPSTSPSHTAWITGTAARPAPSSDGPLTFSTAWLHRAVFPGTWDRGHHCAQLSHNLCVFSGPFVCIRSFCFFSFCTSRGQTQAQGDACGAGAAWSLRESVCPVVRRGSPETLRLAGAARGVGLLGSLSPDDASCCSSAQGTSGRLSPGRATVLSAFWSAGGDGVRPSSCLSFL